MIKYCRYKKKWFVLKRAICSFFSNCQWTLQFVFFSRSHLFVFKCYCGHSGSVLPVSTAGIVFVWLLFSRMRNSHTNRERSRREKKIILLLLFICIVVAIYLFSNKNFYFQFACSLFRRVQLTNAVVLCVFFRYSPFACVMVLICARSLSLSLSVRAMLLWYFVCEVFVVFVVISLRSTGLCAREQKLLYSVPRDQPFDLHDTGLEYGSTVLSAQMEFKLWHLCVQLL